MYTPLSSSLRFVVPKIELLARDRRSGAYPTKARTGDRTRTGKNKLYFDDTRSVVFETNTIINLPTTFHTGSSHLSNDLTSSFVVVGDVKAHAVDQWIAHRDQVESLGPFVEENQHEQDETNTVNSSFMTGVAYNVASDRFKSKISNKTIIKLNVPLTRVSQLSATTSSIMYLTPSSGSFVQRVAEKTNNPAGQTHPAWSMAPIAFTPYGMHFLPLSDYKFTGYSGGTSYTLLPNADVVAGRATTYAGDGSDPSFFDPDANLTYDIISASVLNPAHRALPSQMMPMSGLINHPFLVEKIVIEMPFAAGPGWLNDRFGFNEVFQDDLTYTADVGGPMITMALMRQDGTGNGFRDLIASATITNALDMMTGTYRIVTSTYSGVGGYRDVTITPEGIGGMLVNPTVVITGTDSPSGSNNFYTGSLKFVLEPQITSHVLRFRMSGSAFWYWGPRGVAYSNFGVPLSQTFNVDRPTMAEGLAVGPISRRSSKYLASSRNILGNQFALIEPDSVKGNYVPVNVMDSQYENLGGPLGANPRTVRNKIYVDVRSKTTKCPYLLYPEDNLVVCLNKHRAVGPSDAYSWDLFSGDNQPLFVQANHDVAIPRGNFKITLYGDLIKEDREFHDTLNQRLETAEIWETIGEESILDQFDVTYAEELSGSYLDRFNALNVINQTYKTNITSSRESQYYYSNFTQGVGNPTWNTQYNWSNSRKISELKKSSRCSLHNSDNEIFWDSRIVNPGEIIKSINPTIRLGGLDLLIQTWFSLSTGTEFWGGTGTSQYTLNTIKDWGMRYPFEPKHSSFSQQFSNTLQSDLYSYKLPGAATIVTAQVSYDDITYEVGSNLTRYYASENNVDVTMTSGMSKPEFLKAFFGIGDGVSSFDNQHVTYGYYNASTGLNAGVILRGWKYGMMNAFPVNSNVVFRRDRYGQLRDMFEQRLDSKFYNNVSDNVSTPGVRSGPVQVTFHDREGNITDPELTLSSNLSYEVTSSVPYTDGVARNRGTINYANLNISSVL